MILRMACMHLFIFNDFIIDVIRVQSKIRLLDDVIYYVYNIFVLFIYNNYI